MRINDLDTPIVTVDLDKLNRNISEMSSIAKGNNLELWPMIKTHKSEYILKKQLEKGATGMLVAKPSEAEKLKRSGAKNVMLAYPVINNSKKILRLKRILNEYDTYLTIDSIENAKIINEIGENENKKIKVVIKIDSGLNRLGVKIESLESFYNIVKNFKNIIILGISTHGGHVYKATNTEDVIKAGIDEVNSINKSSRILEKQGLDCSVKAIGSTPTVKTIKNFDGINQIRPGNYVFYDAVQVALGIVEQDRCALSVISTVLSVKKDRAVIDAGSKILGLDMGAHGNNRIKGHGIVIGRNDIRIESLSEELGIIKYGKDKELKEGQNLKIIPNHACTVTNMVDKIYGYRNKVVEKEIEITARGFSQ